MDVPVSRWVPELARAMTAFGEAVTDYPRLLDLIARSACAVTGAFCVINLVSADGEWLEPVAAHASDPDTDAIVQQLMVPARVRLTSDSLSGHVVRTGEVLHLREVTPELMHARFPAEVWPLVDRLAVRSVVQVPLRSQGVVIGTVLLNRHGAQAASFDDDDVEIAQHVADQAALAIVNARLFAAAERLSLRLRIVSDAASEFSTAENDIASLLDAIVRRLANDIGDFASLLLLDEAGASLQLGAATHHRDPALAEALRDFTEPRFAADEGVAGIVLRSGQPTLRPEVTPAEIAAIIRPSRVPSLHQLDVRSLMGVPLVARGKTTGVIVMGRSGPGRSFNTDDLELLRDIAAYAALAIANGALLTTARNELAERIRAERELSSVQEQLRQAQKMEAIGRLAGGVAHDFNNALSVIFSYSALLGETIPALDERRENVEQIQHAAERAAEITKQLLAFSRQQVTQPRVLDLNDLVSGMRRMLVRLLGENVELRLDLERDVGRVRADPGHIEQVLMNLAINGRDAMADGGVLTITTRNVELDEDTASHHVGLDAGAYVMLAVRDTGCGMDRATLERIFEPFFTTKPVGKGTGLGLSTVFGIVHQSGGDVLVHSAPGRGTTFEVCLPRTLELATAVAAPIPPRSLDGNETILVVEDEAPLRSVARTVLTMRGYRVLEAANADEAIRLCAADAGPIDLLFTDVVMPGMSGRDLANRLVADRPALRVLYTSGYTDGAIVQNRVLEDGGALLQKPYTPSTLLRRVRELLDA